MGQPLDPQCPFTASHPQWSVKPSLRGQTLTVKLSHNSVPVSLCKRTGPNCTRVNTSLTGSWQLQLHDPGSSDCLEAWRTDVSFSPRVLVCPADLAHRWRWTLPLLLCLVLLSLGVLTAVLLRRSFKSKTPELLHSTTPTFPYRPAPPLPPSPSLSFSPSLILSHLLHALLASSFSPILTLSFPPSLFPHSSLPSPLADTHRSIYLTADLVQGKSLFR
ncbi:UNVERIFIED_CONTAM: hypothetical protein FKN15_052567 [Acipenser sinensis]